MPRMGAVPTKTSESVNQRLTQLREKVEVLISHKMMENMTNLGKLYAQLSLKNHWKPIYTWEQEARLKYVEDNQIHYKNGEPIPERSKSSRIDAMQNFIPEIQSKTIRIPSNARILSILKNIEPHVNDFEDVWVTLSAWLELQMSCRPQTGLNFRNNVISVILKQMETFASLRLLGVEDYLDKRAKLGSDLKKNAGLEDVYLALDMVDYSYAKLLDSILIKMQNAYLIAYNSLVKNWDIIISNDDGQECSTSSTPTPT